VNARLRTPWDNPVPGTPFVQNCLWLAAIFAAGAIARWITPRTNSPAVLELLGGVVLGNLGLLGVSLFEPMKQSGFLHALSQIGVSFLLFQIGLESTIVQMRQVGLRALMVALTGVSGTFLLGLLFCPLLIQGLGANTYVFLAASLTATSVGITARILKDIEKSRTGESQIVIGAAVIDDIIGLVLLVLTTTLIRPDSPVAPSAGISVLKVTLFIAGALVLGRFASHFFPRLLSRVFGKNNGTLITALLFFAVFGLAFLAAGLPAIIGCFIGGLVLERKRFTGKEPETLEVEWTETERVVSRLGKVCVPVFFVMTGLGTDLSAMLSLQSLTVALGLTAVAVAGKLSCGLAAGKGASGWVVGVGMIPRGEVQLIYASTGLELGALSSGVYSSIVIVVMVTTVLAPIVLIRLLRGGARTGQEI
jgi:Kef-type K+ transport system membrane component KefB